MANNLESNFTRKVARSFLPSFEASRVLSKNVNTQLLDGKFNPASGANVDFKRPTDYVSISTATGDVSGSTPSDITAGKATGTVQDYITVLVEYDEVDEALKMDQLDELLAPMGTRIVTDLELKMARHMMVNSGLLSGTPGTALTTWDQVARAGATMTAAGIPADDQWNFAVNPYTQTKLASDQRSIGAGGAAGEDINRANRMAVINEDYAGMRVMKASTLASFTTPATGDLVGAVNGAPAPTYLAAKDTMTQAVTVDGFGAFGGVIPAGTVVQFTGSNRLNLATRQPIIDDTGATIVHTAVLVADATLVGGAGTLIVSGPGIFEAGGAYNTIESAIADNSIVTILNADSTLFQPNLFWHKQAFSIGSVPLKKLHSTDTLITTEDGLRIRVSKGADFLGNKQMVRFDLLPAFATLNPFFAGQGFGV